MLDKIYKILNFIVNQYLIIRDHIISRCRDIQDWQELLRRFVSFLIEIILFLLDKTKDQKILEDAIYMSIYLTLLAHQVKTKAVTIHIVPMVILGLIILYIWEYFTGKKDL